MWLVATLTRLAPTFRGEISDDTSLTDEGLCLDSLALTDLIGEIETELGVIIEEEDISPETLGTVGSLLEFLALRSGGRFNGSR